MLHYLETKQSIIIARHSKIGNGHNQPLVLIFGGDSLKAQEYWGGGRKLYLIETTVMVNQIIHKINLIVLLPIHNYFNIATALIVK